MTCQLLAFTHIVYYKTNKNYLQVVLVYFTVILHTLATINRAKDILACCLVKLNERASCCEKKNVEGYEPVGGYENPKKQNP